MHRIVNESSIQTQKRFKVPLCNISFFAPLKIFLKVVCSFFAPLRSSLQKYSYIFVSLFLFYFFFFISSTYADNTINTENSSSLSQVEQTRFHEETFFNVHTEKKINLWISFESGIKYLYFQKIITSQSGSENINTQNNIEEIVAEQGSLKQEVLIQIDCLKFNPKYFLFSTHFASENNQGAKTLALWNKEKNLLSSINASMFLPDNLTSNGYLKNADHVNNKRIASRLGGFFVATPKKTMHNGVLLPESAIIYKDDIDFIRFGFSKNMQDDSTQEDILQAILDNYSVVVQNFKLLEVRDNILLQNNLENSQKYDENITEKWQSNKRHSILAIAEDADGNILFLHSYLPTTIKDFIKAIKGDPLLNLTRALYVEGGKHASMSLNVQNFQKHWRGQNAFLLMLADQLKLPNIIGVQAK